MNFKNEPLEVRRKISAEITSKYPGRLPTIVVPATKNDPQINKHKFLVPDDIPMGKFLAELRKHIAKIDQHQAIFLFCKTPAGNEIMCNSASNMSVIYSKYAHEDGFLYFVYTKESTFGAFRRATTDC